VEDSGPALLLCGAIPCKGLPVRLELSALVSIAAREAGSTIRIPPCCPHTCSAAGRPCSCTAVLWSLAVPCALSHGCVAGLRHCTCSTAAPGLELLCDTWDPCTAAKCTVKFSYSVYLLLGVAMRRQRKHGRSTAGWPAPWTCADLLAATARYRKQRNSYRQYTGNMKGKS